MEDVFDPYHTWLGISPKDQPPHHYRLLSVDLFEEDPEVVSTAADGRMAHVKQFQAGKHSKESQQILNEIARAKVVLLDPDRKADYDADLREEFADLCEQPEPAESAAPTPPPLPPDLADSPSGEQRVAGPPPVAESGTAVATVAPSPESSDPAEERKDSSSPAVVASGPASIWQTPLVKLGIAMAVAMLFGLAVFQLVLSDGQDVADQPEPPTTRPDDDLDAGVPPDDTGPDDSKPDDDDAASVDTTSPGDPDSGEVDPTDTSPDTTEPGTTETSPAEPDGPEDEPSGGLAVFLGRGGEEDFLENLMREGEPDEGNGGTPDSGEPGGTDTATEPAPDSPVDTPPPKPAPVKRPAVPGQDKQRKMRREVRELFDDEFDDAKTPEKKLALAKQLLEQAEASKDDPDARYVALRMVSELANEAGDVYGAMGVAKTMEQLYDVEPLSEMVRTLAHANDRIPSGSRGSATAERAADAAMELAEGCVARGKYEVASRLADLAMSAARKTRDSQLIRPLASRSREIDRLKGRLASFEKARDTLEAKPDDPEANLTAGRWYCYERREWDKGLPLLAKGRDKELADMARRDMETPDDNPASQVAVADGWRKLADDEKDLAKEAAQARAQRWYRRAVPSLEGLDRVRAKKWADTLAKDAAAAGQRRKEQEALSGAVRPGNVALASNGTKVRGVTSGASALLDGNSTKYSSSSGFAGGKFPCEWTITFNKVYRLKGIRFKLYDGDSRYYRYAVATSPDGKKYSPLVNCNQGKWRGWQAIRVPTRPVKSIKLFGLHNSSNSQFHVVEFEAYCIIPE